MAVYESGMTAFLVSVRNSEKGFLFSLMEFLLALTCVMFVQGLILLFSDV